jgi:hypothetical protein
LALQWPCLEAHWLAVPQFDADGISSHTTGGGTFSGTTNDGNSATVASGALRPDLADVPTETVLSFSFWTYWSSIP